MVLLALTIVVKMGIIQFAEGDKWNALAAQMRLQYREVEATRGNILSDNGSLMATSIPFYRLALDPSRGSNELLGEELDVSTFPVNGVMLVPCIEGAKREILQVTMVWRRKDDAAALPDH